MDNFFCVRGRDVEVPYAHAEPLLGAVGEGVQQGQLQHLHQQKHQHLLLLFTIQSLDSDLGGGDEGVGEGSSDRALSVHRDEKVRYSHWSAQSCRPMGMPNFSIRPGLGSDIDITVALT